MSLPILKSAVHATPETLVRFFDQTELQWTRHTSEETQLDVGTAMHNAQLPRTYMANRMLDVALPPNVTPAQAMDEVAGHFAAQGVPCWQWVMNPSALSERTLPMIEFLRAQGYREKPTDIMHLPHLPGRPIEGTAGAGLTIIPARASFRHARTLFDESARRWNTPELAEASMMHLDDPHFDALLALKDGAPVANVGVLAMGEVGLIEQVFVTETKRRQGIATVMMGRALEICARSLFKHILLGVAPDNLPAIHLYDKFGFRKIGQLIAYLKT